MASYLTKDYLSAKVANIPGKTFFWNYLPAVPNASTKTPRS
jgi:hypothetical protein